MILPDLIAGFLRVGLFAFGGAYGAIPLIRDVVSSYGWLDDGMLTTMIAVSESTPGPIMVNLATYTGKVQAGIPGAAAATLAVVLPSFVIVLLLTSLMKTALKNPYIKAVLQGLKPCVTGIVLATGVIMLLKACLSDAPDVRIDWVTSALAIVLGAVYFGSRKFKKGGISPILLIVLSAAAGVLVYGA